MPTSPEVSLIGSLLTLLRDGGVIACLLLFIVGLIRRWWVLGWQYEEMRSLAFRGTDIAEKAADTAVEVHKR